MPEAANAFNNYVFLDAREAEEYNVSHILNARFVRYKNFSTSGIGTVNKNEPIVGYCAIGKRSDEITKKLRDAGFTNARNLYGGIFEWVNQDILFFVEKLGDIKIYKGMSDETQAIYIVRAMAESNPFIAKPIRFQAPIFSYLIFKAKPFKIVY